MSMLLNLTDCVIVCAQEMMATTPGLVAHVVNLAALVLLPMVVIHVHSDGFSLGEYAPGISQNETTHLNQGLILSKGFQYFLKLLMIYMYTQSLN